MENQTLTFTLVIVASISNLALFINWANNRHIPGLQLITLGFLATSAGSVLLAFTASLSPLISVLIANALILGGRIPIVMGLAQFWNQEKSRLPALCLFLFILTLGGLYYFSLVEPLTLWRIRLYTAMMLIFYLCNIYVIANGLRIERRLRPVMSISSNFGAFLALMLFGFNTITEFILMTVRTDLVDSSGSTDLSLMILGTVFTLAVFAFAIIIMTMEELSVEHKENAIYDPITTILNERTFMEVGHRIVGVALRYSQPVSMLTIEVENMEDIVRDHGYKVANQVLRHFSLMATDRRRHEDVLARTGLKQFRMLLPGVDETGAQIVAQKIQDTVAGEQYVYRGRNLDIAMRVAVTTSREEDLNLQQMLQEGEIAMTRSRRTQEAVAAGG